MASLKGVTVTSREDEIDEPANPVNQSAPTNTGKSVRRRKRKNSSGTDSGNEEQVIQPAVGQVNSPPTAQHYRARFYETYCQEAEEYDKEFTKKHDEDLNATLIFAGLFSAVTSVFIIEVNSQLKPDPNEDSAALLRVLIHKMDNTTFGNNVPTIPQWTGPSPTIVHVQAILFASLAVSLLAAFLAVLGKQWLNRYTSSDVRGSAVGRGQGRQQKLDGIVTWYFDHVMQSLPLMLQAGLLLLGCALSRYLWEVNTIVASVVVGVTSFGVLFYLFIVVAGASSVNCPYQTPVAQVLRHIPDILRHILEVVRHIPYLPVALRSVFSAFFGDSRSNHLLITAWKLLRGYGPHHTLANVALSPLFILLLPVWFAVGACRIVIWVLVVFPFTAYFRSQEGSGFQTAALDLQCILWTLQTSLDEQDRLSTLNYLARTTLADPDPALVSYCFDILISCVNVVNNKAVIIQGKEQLATATSLCCLHTLSHLMVTGSVPAAVGLQYGRAFPGETNLNDLPLSHTLGAIHRVFYPGIHYSGQFPQWMNHKLSRDDHAIVANALTKLAWYAHRTSEWGMVPRWLLRFALHSLSQSPQPPTSVVINCLSIIATDLQCEVLGTTTLDESAQLNEVTSKIIQKLEHMVELGYQFRIYDMRKAISALVPYAFFLERCGQRRMADAILRAARASSKHHKFLWNRLGPYVFAMFDKPNPPSLSWLLELAAPLRGPSCNEDVATGQAATGSHTGEVGRSVVSRLLRIVFTDPLRPQFLDGSPEQSKGAGGDLIRQIRALGDIKILKSYLLLVWSGYDPIDDQSGGLAEMLTSIREEFGGIGMGRHRGDLIERLNHILGRSESPDLRDSDIQLAKEQYGELRKVLLEVDREAVNQLVKFGTSDESRFRTWWTPSTAGGSPSSASPQTTQ